MSRAFAMSVESNGEYPTDGLYDVFMTMERDGRTEIQRVNTIPLSLERAKQYVRPLLRMMGTNVDKFASVKDVNITQMIDAPRFDSEEVRDLWLTEMVQRMAERRRLRHKAAESAVCVDKLMLSGDVSRAKHHLYDYVDYTAQLLHLSPTAREMDLLKSTMSCVGRHFTTTAEIERIVENIANEVGCMVVGEKVLQDDHLRCAMGMLARA